MGLPYIPESVESIKARYPEAVKDIFDVKMILATGERPGLYRKHVFDFEDGVRIIVSRERTDDSSVFLHISLSVLEDSPALRLVEESDDPKSVLAEMVVERVELMGGPSSLTTPVNSFMTKGGVLHIIYAHGGQNPMLN